MIKQRQMNKYMDILIIAPLLEHT